MEQLFPLPEKEIASALAQYTNANDIVWAQEEPRNMGAWGYLLLQHSEAARWRCASRRTYGAPAAGSAARSLRRHQQVIEYVFDASQNNQIRKNK